MDRKLTTKEKWQDRRKVIIRWSAGVAAAVLAVVLLAVLIQPSVRESSLKLAAGRRLDKFCRIGYGQGRARL